MGEGNRWQALLCGTHAVTSVERSITEFCSWTAVRAQEQTSSLTRSQLLLFAVGANMKQFFLTANV